jgi:hypothetical protein
MDAYRIYLKGEGECPALNINQEEIYESISNNNFHENFELVNDYLWQFISKVH